MQRFDRGISSKMVIRFPTVNSLINKGDGEMQMASLQGCGSLRAARPRAQKVAPCSGIGDFLLHACPKTKER